MGLKLICGNSGCGKTEYLYREITDLAAADSRQNFYVVVPEQFTLAAQRALAEKSPGGVIINIDVVSFERLAYRVFNELGIHRKIMEDTGKSLLLRRISQEREEDLTIFRGSMRRAGYVDEVRSFISELMQYGITCDELRSFAEKQTPGTTLFYKLSDIVTMYEGFSDYMRDNVMTSEMILDVLAGEAERSSILKNAVFAFDGFTGFTPVQMKLMHSLMHPAKDIYVTVTIDSRESITARRGIENLFYMSGKMINSLYKAAGEENFKIDTPVILGRDDDIGRHSDNRPLKFLGDNIFRPGAPKFCEDCSDVISIYSLKTPKDELEFAASSICRMVRSGGDLRYKDFAVVCADMSRYEEFAETIFSRYNVPCFADKKRSVLYHPCSELILAVLDIADSDFSQESVFRYLRSGLAGFTREETDLLENYCIARGIRGHGRWSKKFIKPAAQRGRARISEEAASEELSRADYLRDRLWDQLKTLYKALTDKSLNVRSITEALYKHILSLDLQVKLDKKQKEFERAGDELKALEYRQIYRIIIDLLDKTVDLLGDENVSVREYSDILTSGLTDARVGIIPPGNDCVIIGDIERTRLDGIKVLFFLGVNDGIVPAAAAGSGILSDYERELVKAQDLEIAPSASELSFMQRFYLYLLLTKPKDKLILTYSQMDGAFKASRPSYLIGTMLRLFPRLEVKNVSGQELCSCLTQDAAFESFIYSIMNTGMAESGKNLSAIRYVLSENEKYGKDTDELIEAAFSPVPAERISSDEACDLYGKILINSVTRLELFEGCPFAHFLEYGLKLSPREEYSFEAFDLGTMLHEIMRIYCEKVEADASWDTVTNDQQESFLREAVNEAVLKLPNDLLLESKRGEYMLERIYRIMKSSAAAITKQIAAGNFRPGLYEYDFCSDAAGGAAMRLVGRIDRIDVCEDKDGRIFVKIVDYKSGSTRFDLCGLYYGRQMQLVVYLKAAVEKLRRANPGKKIVPGGIFYQKLDDPMTDVINAGSTDDELQKCFKPEGLVNLDSNAFKNMDTNLKDKSLYIPVSLNKDGSVSKSGTSGTTDEGFEKLSGHTDDKIADAAGRIMSGDIEIKPVMIGDSTGCDFCACRGVCGFDLRRQGFSYDEKLKLKDDDVWSRLFSED